MGYPPIHMDDVLNAMQLKGAHGEVRINCPHCPDVSHHCHVSVDKGLYHCFKCGAGGKIITSKEHVMDASKYDAMINSVKTELDSGKSLYFPDRPMVRNTPVCEPAHRIPRAMTYLNRRGVTDNEIVKYNIGYCVEQNSIYTDSIIFPVYKSDYNRTKLDYFVARKLHGEPKYLNAPWPKEKSLFIGIPVNQINDYRSVVICEGIFDAIAIARCGFVAYALLGKKATPAQLELLTVRNKYIIFLDGDAFEYAAGLALQLRTMAESKGSNMVIQVVHIAGSDPDSAIKNDPSRITKLLEATSAKFRND